MKNKIKSKLSRLVDSNHCTQMGTPYERVVFGHSTKSGGMVSLGSHHL